MMRSPNDIQAAAIQHMLDGKPPQSDLDWRLLANFWAANVQKGLEVSCLPLLGMILECPLSKGDLVEIAKFQYESKPHV